VKSIRIRKENEKIYFYDFYGKFQYAKVLYTLFMLTIFSTIYQFAYLVLNGIITLKFSKNMLHNLWEHYIFVQQNFYNNFFTYDFFSQKIQLYILPFYLIFGYIILSIYMYFKSQKVQKLNKLGLEDYKITKCKNAKMLELKSRKYEEFDFEYVAKMKDDIIQIFQFSTNINVLITRYRKDRIRIQTEKQFAKILNFDMQKLQKNKFYLGQKIINNAKFEDDYLDFSQLLHTAILGTSGGGKSVFLNHLIINIFYNFELLKEFYFIDFKGGIEAQTYVNIAQKLNLKNVITCDNNIQKLHKILTDIYNINQDRMKILKEKNLKKWTNEYIFLVFDEFAQIFQFNSKNKDEKKLLDDCINIIENLFATARSQNIRIIYSTQSYVKEASGVSNAIKVNTSAKFMFNTKAITSISSVVSADILDEYQLNPKLLKKGEALILDVEDVEPHRFKSPYTENLQDILINILQQR
jgi:hypothetical protein